MSRFDYIIVGAGSAGSVLANRLSADRHLSVLLIESGPPDKSAYIHVPKGSVKLFGDPRLVWQYPIESSAPGIEPAQPVWVRGRTLGGSSSINGMMYVRGQPQDYDHWEELGNTGWGWRHIAPCFQRMEDHELGADDLRGAGGPLRISCRPRTYPICDAMIAAGVEMGLRAKDDLNRLDQEGVGYYQMTIARGRRASAAVAFLNPIKHRSNLRILTGTTVDRLVFDGTRCTGVAGRAPDGAPVRMRAAEVIVAAGALQSPKLLQLSGIGDAGHLRSLGIDVLVDRPAVGANMREHPVQSLQFRLKQPLSHNAHLRGLGLARTMLAYYLWRRNVIAGCGYEVGAFARTRPDLDRPDIQLHMAPFSFSMQGGKYEPEPEPGMQCIGNPLRPESLGSVALRSTDPDATPVVRPNYLSAAYDRQVLIDMVRYMRRYFAQPAMARHLTAETFPGPAVQSDDEIIDCFHRFGQSGFHATGTCRMGIDPDAVVDARLRLRGVSGVRVADCSVMPTLVSGNTNGPAMALGWRASELILEDR